MPFRWFWALWMVLCALIVILVFPGGFSLAFGVLVGINCVGYGIVMMFLLPL